MAILRYPNHRDNDKDDYSRTFETSISLSKESLYLFKDQIISDLPNTIVSYFVKLLTQSYLNQLYSAFKTYNVDYTEINDALEKLQIDSTRYDIIGTGGIDNNLNPIIALTINGHDANICIFPKGKTISVLEKFDLEVSKKIEGENILLSFKGIVNYRIPMSFRFLRLRIINGLFDG